jgi:tetratricopeptide (TPR) repeat protein
VTGRPDSKTHTGCTPGPSSRALAAVLLAGTLCSAQPTLAQAPPAALEAKARVAVFLVPARGYKAQIVARVSRTLIKQLRKNEKLDVEDSDKLLVEFSGEVPRRTIAKANDALEQGIKQLKLNEINEALASLQGAIEIYEQVLAFIKKKTLARAYMARAIAQAEARNHSLARASFVRLLTWRPHLRYDTATFTPRHLPIFERARELVKKLKRGSIELTSSPRGAKAYVDGRFMGVTPTVAFGLKVGDHYASFKKEGFIKAAQKVTISSHSQGSSSQQLKRAKKYLLLKQSLSRAKSGLGKAKANAAMVDLRSVLYIDQALFATIGYAGPGKLYIQAYLYDLRSKLRLNQAAMTVDQRSLVEGIKKLVGLLYLNVRTDGSLQAPPEAPPPPPETRAPLYATWWFWTAIGAGIATAIIVPYYAWPRSENVPDNLMPVGANN